MPRSPGVKDRPVFRCSRRVLPYPYRAPQLARAVIGQLLSYNTQEQIWLDCLPGADTVSCLSTRLPGVTTTPASDIATLANTIRQRTPAPDTIFFGGLNTGAGQLRQQLGSQFLFVVPSDAVNQSTQFFAAVGSDASNIYATFPGLDPRTFTSGPAASFVAHYQKSCNGRPGQYSANGYDAAQIIIETLRHLLRPGMSLAEIRHRLVVAVLGHSFVSGVDHHLIRFDEDGDNIGSHAYTIYQSAKRADGWTWQIA